jgi:hypothetical protein
METSTFVQQEKVQKPAICRKTDVYSFWDSQGPVLERYQERSTTINSARYSDVLTDRLNPAT